MQSKTVRFWQYTAKSEKKRNYAFSAKTWSETKRFFRKGWVKLCDFCKNAIFTKIRLCRGILHLICNFLQNAGPRPWHLLNGNKKMWKKNLKIHECVPLNHTENIINFVYLQMWTVCHTCPLQRRPLLQYSHSCKTHHWLLIIICNNFVLLRE